MIFNTLEEYYEWKVENEKGTPKGYKKPVEKKTTRKKNIQTSTPKEK